MNAYSDVLLLLTDLGIKPRVYRGAQGLALGYLLSLSSPFVR